MLNPIGHPTLDRRRFLFGCAVASLSGCTVATARPREAERMAEFAMVIRGGRVVDPGQGVDMSVDLAIEDTRVAAIGPNLRGRTVLDAVGCVVAPGFIDLHSHAQTVSGHRLQAFDGVTTTLELEAGAIPVAGAYARASVEGRPLNYGYSASWAGARIQVLAGDRGNGQTMLARFADPAWQREATAAEEDRILGTLETEVGAGALGIGVLVGYAPRTSLGEYLRVAQDPLGHQQFVACAMTVGCRHLEFPGRKRQRGRATSCSGSCLGSKRSQASIRSWSSF